MNSWESALRLLPPELAERLGEACAGQENTIEELRIRRDRPLCLRTAGGERTAAPDRPVTDRDIRYVLANATGASFHTAADTIRKGYITVQGGCRIGLCGEGTGQNGTVGTLRNISSLCIRLPREIPGCADALFGEVWDGGFHSTLIISPPGGGKTTLLRELVRKLSGEDLRVALADERGEIAAMYQGRPQFDVGARTDVLANVTKCQAGIMLIRTMAPDVLAMDEITAAADLPAVLEATGCGVGLLATVHGQDVPDLRRKPMFSRLLTCGAFEKAVCIRKNRGHREYQVVTL